MAANLFGLANGVVIASIRKDLPISVASTSRRGSS